jgi:hypothetical protein
MDKDFRQIEADMKSEMQDILYPYVKKTCEQLQAVEETLKLEDRILFERLKCSIKIYELEKEAKERIS